MRALKVRVGAGVGVRYGTLLTIGIKSVSFAVLFWCCVCVCSVVLLHYALCRVLVSWRCVALCVTLCLLCDVVCWVNVLCSVMCCVVLCVVCCVVSYMCCVVLCVMCYALCCVMFYVLC